MMHPIDHMSTAPSLEGLEHAVHHVRCINAFRERFVKLMVRISVLAASAALLTGCVTPQKKEDGKGVPVQAGLRDAGTPSAGQPVAQQADASKSSLPLQATCSAAKWLGQEWGGRIAYAGGDCDNFGKPTGMATVRVNPPVLGETGSGESYLVEGLFVAGKAVPGTQYTVRAQKTLDIKASGNGIGVSASMTCTNLWHQPDQPLTGKDDAECQFSFAHSKKVYLSAKISSNNTTTLVQRTAGKLTGPVVVTSPRGGHLWAAKFDNAKGSVRIDAPFPGSLLDELNQRVSRSIRRLEPTIAQSKLASVSTLTLQGVGGSLDARHGLTGAWVGDIEFVMGGETLTAKGVSLSDALSFCGDNPSVTLVDRSGRSLVLHLTVQKWAGGVECYPSGFTLQNGARLTASASEYTEGSWPRGVRSAFYLAAASTSSPSDFRFGPLQLMPIWGTVTWPDGRVFDGRFENGKPIGQ